MLRRAGIVGPDGVPVDAGAWEGKNVALYFSSRKCGGAGGCFPPATGLGVPPRPAARVDSVSLSLFPRSLRRCAPCRRFTPILKEARASLIARGVGLEVVFVSSDLSKKEMKQYHRARGSHRCDRCVRAVCHMHL